MRQSAFSSPSWGHRAFTATRMVLHQILRSAEKRGVAPESLLPLMDLREAPVHLTEHAPLVTILEIWERSLSRLSDRTFPLDVAIEAQERPVSVLGFLCRASSTPRVAIQTLIRYWGQVTTASAWALVEQDARASLELRPWFECEESRPRLDGPPSGPQARESMLSLGWACQLEFDLLDVAFGLRAMLPQDQPVLLGMPYGVSPRWIHRLSALGFALRPTSSSHLIELDKKLLDLPLRQADPRLAKFLQVQLEHDHTPAAPVQSLAQQVRLLLSVQLDQGEPFLNRVASQLKLSRRTLQRQLEEAGFTFRDLLDQVRQEQALQHQGALKAEALAERLGYSDARALRRARRRWAGASAQSSKDGSA